MKRKGKKLSVLLAGVLCIAAIFGTYFEMPAVLAAETVQEQEEPSDETVQTRLITWEGELKETEYNATPFSGEVEPVVVVLDAGHDSTHAGARANGLIEESMNLRIAQYCQEELSKYDNVTIYMTRTEEGCPFGGTSNEDNQRRVDFAKEKDADLFVSFHLNSATTTSANGTSVYHPNENYNAQIGIVGRDLAAKIQEKLIGIGLNDRGILIRNSEDNTLYPDGSLADYYGIIRRAKLSGFPGVIIEHAFLTGDRDAVFLAEEQNLKAMGIADAEGIAEYLGLKKKNADSGQDFSPVVPDVLYFGDVNRNGSVTADDALLALRHVVKMSILQEEQVFKLADMDHNGAVTAEDALQILQTSVKIISQKQYDPDAVYTPKTPVDAHGQLAVRGTRLVDQSGSPVQLRGVSTHGINWFPDYVNQESFRSLRDDWHVNVVRLAMYTAEYNGYCSGGDQTQLKNLLYKGIDAATALGMYVIVDWHILSDSNPKQYMQEAVKFFDEVSARYQNSPNVLYEICNEPNGGTTWADVKEYAAQVIPVIRRHASKAVILVGTPNWSQYVDQAAADPITGYDNLMYSLHFYSATHKDDIRSKLTTALSKGLPVFVTEFSTSEASGNGYNDFAETEKWLNLLDQNQISYVCWSLSNKGETSALLSSGYTGTTSYPVEQLSENGKWIRSWYRNKELTK